MASGKGVQRGERPVNWAAITSLTTGLTAVGALIFTGLSLNATRDQVAIAQNQNALAEQGQLTDRYSKAVEQIGQEGVDHLQVRLGGVYALERLARDSPRDQPTIIAVLSAYVRTTAPSSPANGKTCEGQPIGVDVQAALTVLSRRDPAHDNNTQIDLNDTCLYGADLNHANLYRANLRHANLNNANLSFTDLRGARLGGASISGSANLGGANLGGAYLNKANLSGIWVGEANLNDADLSGANLNEAYLDLSDLKRANLTLVDLRDSHLSGADFSSADLRGVDFSGADFNGADLRGARHGTAWRATGADVARSPRRVSERDRRDTIVTGAFKDDRTKGAWW